MITQSWPVGVCGSTVQKLNSRPISIKKGYFWARPIKITYSQSNSLDRRGKIAFIT